jgi:hypothetical protein
MRTATYSPEDNKLRLYSVTRLSREVYDRVKAAGFIWAPKQELFVAPMWTPAREDLLTELCGEIGDEDTSLVERAEERADRFEDYSDRRGTEAERAHAAVERITDGIPLGQPILIGHHSERHARRDAERIENGMRKAVKLWETSKYWTDRAAGAISHAKYKELPAVRARRIKGLEADKRKREREIAEAVATLRAWRKTAPITHSRARALANVAGLSFYRCYPLSEFPRNPPASQYEGSMGVWSALGDTPEEAVISPAAARFLVGRGCVRIIRHARRWVAHYENRLAYERAMLGESGGLPTDKKGPEKGGACQCWASPGFGKGWSYIKKVNKVSVTVEDNWGNGGRNFTRTISFDKLKRVMTAAEVAEAKTAGRLAENFTKTGFFLGEPVAPRQPVVAADSGEDAKFQALAETLKAGVKVVTAPQLFPTPPAIARRVVELAEIREGHTVLEPSAGTGNLVRAVLDNCPAARVSVVEINPTLLGGISAQVMDRRCADFLECNGDLGTFDRVVMNPPFCRGSDIEHVKHAFGMLKPGGPTCRHRRERPPPG